MKTLAIVGAGDLGQQIAHYALSDNHYDKVVFFDDYVNDKIVNGIPVLGKLNTLKESFEEKKFDELILGIGYKHLKIRKELYELYFKDIPFGKIIHSTSWVDPTAIVEKGTVIYPGCVIDAKATIGANIIMNIACSIAHDAEIGKHCFLSPSVAIAGFVKINECCFIGINSTIIDNINIIANTFLGGGAVVIKSIDKKGLYVGNPAKFIR